MDDVVDPGEKTGHGAGRLAFRSRSSGMSACPSGFWHFMRQDGAI